MAFDDDDANRATLAADVTMSHRSNHCCAFACEATRRCPDCLVIASHYYGADDAGVDDGGGDGDAR